MSEPEPTPPEPTPPVEPTPPEPVQNWMDQAGFDTDLKSNPTLNKYETAEAQARAHIELQKTLGADKVPIPGKDAKPEEWDAVYSRLGRPDTVEGYELTDWQPPEGVPWNMDSTAEMIKRGHARGLTKSQMQGILADQAEVAALQWGDHVEGVGKLKEQTLADLKTKYGAAFDPKMQAGKTAALAIVEKAGLSENPFDQEIPDGSGRKVGDLPGMVEVMMAFGEATGEDGSPGPGVRTTRTPDEAQHELNEMIGDPKRYAILTDASHPEHKDLQARKADLERQIYT